MVLFYVVRVIYMMFEGISLCYEFVVRSFGYFEFEIFRKVMFLMVKNGFFVLIVIFFVCFMGVFGVVLIFVGGSYMNIEILLVMFYLNIFYGNIGMVIMSGIVFVVVLFIVIFFIERLEGGGSVFVRG